MHRYNQLLEREKQPHSDFFVNLSEDFEDELDFSEDRPADLSQYDQYFEWDEAEYMRLRFTAARHYASRGHWTDAYAYVLRHVQIIFPNMRILTIGMPKHGITRMQK